MFLHKSVWQMAWCKKYFRVQLNIGETKSLAMYFYISVSSDFMQKCSICLRTLLKVTLFPKILRFIHSFFRLQMYIFILCLTLCSLDNYSKPTCEILLFSKLWAFTTDRMPGNILSSGSTQNINFTSSPVSHISNMRTHTCVLRTGTLGHEHGVIYRLQVSVQ